jgi:hypothetical protein
MYNTSYLPKSQNNFWFLLASVIVIFFLLFQQCEQQQSLAEKDSLYKSLNDSLAFSKNKNNELVGTISTIRTQNLKDFLKIESQNKEIIKLQELVKTYKNRMGESSVAGIITTKGTVNTTVPTIVINGVSPIYKSSFNLDNWVFGDITASADSTKINLQYVEDISFVIGRQRKNFLSKYEYFSDVTIHNPYSTVQTYRTYQVSDKTKNRFIIGPFFGASLNSEFKIQPTIGIGITYNLISF